MREKSKLSVQWLAPDSLKPYSRNSKLHPPAQVDNIARQIEKFGFDVPIVVDQNMVLIKGHGRLAASQKLGLKKVPVIVRDDLSEDEVKAARIGDNKVAESAWISDMLRVEFKELLDADFDMGGTGFDTSEVDAIISGWSAAPSEANPEGDDPGLIARISVRCRQSDRVRVVTSIESALKGSGLTDVKIT